MYALCPSVYRSDRALFYNVALVYQILSKVNLSKTRRGIRTKLFAFCRIMLK